MNTKTILILIPLIFGGCITESGRSDEGSSKAQSSTSIFRSSASGSGAGQACLSMQTGKEVFCMEFEALKESDCQTEFHGSMVEVCPTPALASCMVENPFGSGMFYAYDSRYAKSYCPSAPLPIDTSTIESSQVSCIFALEGSNIFCFESAVITASDCTDSETGMGGTVLKSCPGGAVKECVISDESGSGNISVYDTSFIDICP